MRYLPLSIAALFLLSACSTPAPAEEPPAPVESAVVEPEGAIMPGSYSEGSFEFTSSFGGTGVIEIPVDAPADLAPMVTDETFLAVDVDNRKGAENINMYSVNLYDEAGREYSFVRETSWMDELPDTSGDDVDAYNARVDLYNSYLDNASPGERRTVYMVGPELPEEFVAVMVEPTGQMEEPVQATPVE